MHRLIVLIASILLMTSCTPAPDAAAQPSTKTAALPKHLTDAVAAPTRPADDRARDADRKPAEVMHFFGIQPGMTVAELMTGRGYYAELLALAVGPTGRVYAHNTPFVIDRFARKPITERLAKPSLKHVVRLDSELEDPKLPAGKLDAVLMILFYHDTYWQKVDRAAMNKKILAALKPGGTFGIIDHRAPKGTGSKHNKDLHRVEASLVKQEILAAGFEFVKESDLLHHPKDDLTTNVFDDAIRGKTDRFVLMFRKPVP